MGYEGWCRKCPKCPNCKGTGVIQDKYRGRKPAPVVGASAAIPASSTNADVMRRSNRLPADIVAKMETFGQFEFDPAGSQVDPGYVWTQLVAPLLPAAQADSAGFLRELAAAVLPAGGWAVYGGSRLVKELLSGDLDDPSYHAMMSAALDFLRELGVPNLRLNGYEWQFWTEHKGRTEVPRAHGIARPIGGPSVGKRADPSTHIRRLRAVDGGNSICGASDK